jgi:hypothetical protein
MHMGRIFLTFRASEIVLTRNLHTLEPLSAVGCVQLEASDMPSRRMKTLPQRNYISGTSFQALHGFALPRMRHPNESK